MSYETFLQTHPEECINKQITCPNGCGHTIMKVDRFSHFSNCSKLLIRCDLCKVIHSKEQAEAHIAQCPEKPLNCELCREEVKRKDLENHKKQECLEATIKCGQCSMEFRRRKKKEHLEECEEGDISCHQCLAQYKRKDKNEHNCFKDMRDLIYILKN